MVPRSGVTTMKVKAIVFTMLITPTTAFKTESTTETNLDKIHWKYEAGRSG
jgi:hypothetical protein